MTKRQGPIAFLAMNKCERESFFAQATKKAITKIHAAGLPTIHGDEHGIYHLYPDGRKEYIETCSEQE